jgi:hypothetical protein
VCRKEVFKEGLWIRIDFNPNLDLVFQLSQDSDADSDLDQSK